MNNIYKLQIKIYNQAEYSRDKRKWLLEPLLLKWLQAEVTSFIDNKVSFDTEDERMDLVQMVTTGAIEEVINALEKERNQETYREIKFAFEKYNA